MFPKRYQRRLTLTRLFSEGLSLLSPALPSNFSLSPNLREDRRKITGMEVQEDEAYHSGQYLQGEQLDSTDSEKHAQNAKRSGPGPHLGTKRQETTMNKSFGKDEGYKSLEMQEGAPSETSSVHVSRRKGKPVAVTPITADTPTTSLAKGLASFNLTRPRISPQHTSIESPSSDYGSGNFPSINTDGGYTSMPGLSLETKQNEPPTTSVPSTSQDSAVKKPSAATVEATVITKTRTESESMDIDVVGTPTEEKTGGMVLPKPPGIFSTVVPVTVTIVPSGQDNKQQGKGGEAHAMGVRKPLAGLGAGGGFVVTGASEREKMGERLTASPTKHLKSKSPSPSPGPSSLSTSPSHLRSESPKSIPSVGENIEIITDTGVGGAMDEEETEFRSRPEGASMKRSASYGTDTIAEYYGRASKKTARLDDDSARNGKEKKRGGGWGERMKG